MNKKLILGLVGEIASGKGTVVEYLEKKYKATSYRFSTPIRDVCKRLHIEITRANMQKISLILREGFGQDIFAKVISEDAKKDKNNLILIDGIRRPADIIHLEKLPEFKLVYISADMKTRYKRIIKRGENTDDAKKTFADFQKDHEAETEIAIPQIGAKSDIKIDNNGDFINLHKQLDDIIK